MTRVVTWVWNHGIVSTFVTGFFTILPIAITLGIMGWMGGQLQKWLGPGSVAGTALRAVGLRFVTNDTVATLIGWVSVLVALWLVGVFIKSTAKYRLEAVFEAVVTRIPIIKSIYQPVAQVVDILRRDGQAEMQGMRVVYCTFGAAHGAGFLGLRASESPYRFGAQDCYVVYIPTSPVPMSGGIVFVPVEAVHTVEMDVEDLMQIYLSLGIMTSHVVPAQYNPAATSA